MTETTLIVAGTVVGLWTLTVLGFGLAMRRQRRAVADLRDALGERDQDLTALQNDLAALTRASLGAGDHLVRVENQLRRLDERQSQTEMRSVSDRPYSQAIQLVQQGAGVDELIQQCGLTRGEADLITMLHGVAQAS